MHIIGTQFKCYNCGKSFQRSVELNTHMKRVHKNIFECSICKPKMKVLQDFHIAHLTFTNTANSMTEMPNECFDMPTFECHICKDKIDNITDLEKHMETHARNNQCKICKAHLTLDELNAHLCGKEKNISCEYCDEKFLSTIKLLDHLKTEHEKKKLYRCHKCTSFFPMILLRHYHMAQHENDLPKKYLCNICGKRFAKYAVLNYHRRSHMRKGNFWYL